MKKILFLFALIPLFFSACEKDNQPTVENKDMPLLSRVLINGEPYMEYTYTRERLIKDEKSKFHYTRHSFNSKNLLTASEFYVDQAMFSSSSTVVQHALDRKEWVNPQNTPKSLTKIYEYNNNGQPVKTLFERNSPSDGEFTLYTFENDRIVRQTMYWHDRASSYIDFFYDNKGNLSREEKYFILDDGTHQLQTTTEYEYDDMKNPYLAFRRLITPGKYTNPNNIIKETYTLHFETGDPSVQRVQIKTNKYIYNHRGYPVKVNGDAEYIYR